MLQGVAVLQLEAVEVVDELIEAPNPPLVETQLEAGIKQTVFAHIFARLDRPFLQQVGEAMAQLGQQAAGHRRIEQQLNPVFPQQGTVEDPIEAADAGYSICRMGGFKNQVPVLR